MPGQAAGAAVGLDREGPERSVGVWSVSSVRRLQHGLLDRLGACLQRGVPAIA